MDQIIEIGEPPIPLRVTESARAKRYALRITPKDRCLRLTIPAGASRDEGVAFAIRRLDWARRHLERLGDAPDRLDFGHKIMIGGQMVTLEASAERMQVTDDGRLLLPGPDTKISAQVKTFLKVRLRDLLVPASEGYARQVGRPISAIRFRDTSSRWGSCTSKGALMYSIRLAMAPEHVALYVAAHEVAHLVEMNHSARYWAIVERLYPNYQEPRAWLKTHGNALHAVPL